MSSSRFRADQKGKGCGLLSGDRADILDEQEERFFFDRRTAIEGGEKERKEPIPWGFLHR